MLSSPCDEAPANADLYGLGIRTAFYLHWFATVAELWLGHKPDTPLALLGLACEAAMFLALAVQTTALPSTLSPAEVYVGLLLASGSGLRRLPRYLWRGVSYLRGRRAPSGTAHGRSPPISGSGFLVLCALLCFQMWFWTSGMQALAAEKGCWVPGYGFLFARIALDTPGFVAWNILFTLGMLVGCVAVAVGKMGLESCWRRKRRRKRRRSSRLEKAVLNELHNVFVLAVTAILTAAVELTVQWNDFRDAYDISTASQIIPLLISAGFAARILGIRLVESFVSDESESGSDSASSASSRPRRVGGPPSSGGRASVGDGGDEGANEGASEEASERASETEGYDADGGGGPGLEEAYGGYPQPPYPIPPMADVPPRVSGVPPLQRPPMAAFPPGGPLPGGPPPPPPAGY